MRGGEAMARDGQSFGKWLAGRIGGDAPLARCELARASGYSDAAVSRFLSGERQPKAQFWVNAMVFLRCHGRFEHPAQAVQGLALLGLTPEEVMATIETTGLTADTQAACRDTMQREGSHTDPPRRPAASGAKAWFLEWLRGWNQPFLNPCEQGVRLPRWFVERPLYRDRLGALLVGEAQPGPRRVVLWGLGGIGKTTLAQALALDPQVLDRYHNGVLWATVGPESEPRAWLRAWSRRLGLTVPEDEPVWSLHERVRQAVNAPWRRHLLVLDNVWRAEDAEPLLVGGPECGVLLTTREQHAAHKLGLETALLEVGEMAPAEAEALVRRRLGPSYRAADAPHLSEMLEQMGGWPLALELGAALASARGWRDVLEALAHDPQVVDLLRFRKPERRQHSLEWTLRVSYARLTQPAQRLFERLGRLAPGRVFTLADVAFLGYGGGQIGCYAGVGGGGVAQRTGGRPLSAPSSGRAIRCPDVGGAGGRIVRN